MERSAEHTNPTTEGIRVLVVEGNAKDAAAVRNSLKASTPNFVVSPARQLWSACQILAGMAIDAVLLGLELPDSEGLEALSELREQSPDTPVLVVGRDLAMGQQAVDAGADDFVPLSDLDPSILGLRVLDAIERRRAKAPEVDEPEPTSVAKPTAKILVVEEDPWVQRLLRRNLTRQGHTVEVLSSPQKALVWVQGATQLDMLVCEVHAAGMDGARLSHHLQKEFPALVTLLVSANGEQPEIVADHPRSFGFLAKPYSLDAFQHAVEDLLEHTASAPATTGE
ncbi:response regulator [Persicimonas caeni]|uniref:Response regulator n=1 Tax=Persicimonas caeni TaxID=2292766 RepID=A0A4Y6PQE2_PERCE|nr:response regulator [Persicimonas caeni]QDG50237.1 response regulator [Persicimonas caeni]QED31458.1 response regulator [Persicimonas caeni]